MSRPPDGRCARCHRMLPVEELRGSLTQGTDSCVKCGYAAVERAHKLPAARAYFKSWPAVLDTHLRLVARVK